MVNATEEKHAPESDVQRPIDLVLSHFNNPRQGSRGWSVHCPAHHDSSPSLSIWEDEGDGHVGLKCYSGCTRASICEHLGIKESDLYVRNNRAYKPARKERKIDILDLAIDKGIPPVLLYNAGVEEGYPWIDNKGMAHKVLRIPYRNLDGSDYSRSRIRTTVTAKTGSFWDGPATDPIIPYGLDRLQHAKDAGYLWMPEGESDCWTFWLHQIPALGIPGAAMYEKIQAEHVAHFPPVLYLIQEPPSAVGKKEAGKQYIAGMVKRLATLNYQGEVYAVSLEKFGVDDPNALHQKLLQEGKLLTFKDVLQSAIKDAIRVDNIPIQPDVDTDSIVTKVEAAIANKDGNALYDLINQIVLLDERTVIKLKGQIQDGMSGLKRSDFSWNDFKLLLNDAKRKHKKNERAYVSNKPQITLGNQLERELDESLSALYKANQPPTMFVRDGKLARIRVDEKDKPGIEVVNEDMIIERLARIVDYVTYNEEKDSYSSAYPTSRIAKSIQSQLYWNFPALETIVEIPTIRDDGSIIDAPGYDKVTRLYYIPNTNLSMPAIPQRPTQEQAHEAMDFVSGFLQDFPWESSADRANALGLALTTVTRHLFNHVPMGLIDATKQSVGKGMLTNFINIIMTGQDASALSPCGNDEELDKQVTAMLMQGEAIIIFDNVEGVLRSPVLSKILTETYHKGRILGSSQMVNPAQKAIWIATGNNLQVGGDMARRSFRIRMITQVSDPGAREDFKYPNLLKSAKKERGDILAALLIIASAWFVAGQPAPTQKIRKIATFSEWSEIIGGMLSFAGVDDFLGNIDILRKEADVDGQAWSLFLEMWKAKLKDDEYKTSQVVAEIKNDDTFADTLPEPLAAIYAKYDKSKDEKGMALARKFGKVFSKQNGTPYGSENLRLVKGEDAHDKVATWKVCGVAGFAGNNSPYPVDENLFSLQDKKEEKNSSQYKMGADDIPRTPRTPQSDDYEDLATDYENEAVEPLETLDDASPDTLFALLRKKIVAGNIVYDGEFLPRDAYYVRIEQLIASDPQKAITEMKNRLAKLGGAL